MILRLIPFYINLYYSVYYSIVDEPAMSTRAINTLKMPIYVWTTCASVLLA